MTADQLFGDRGQREGPDVAGAGVRLVWVVDPQSRLVTVHRPDGTGEVLSRHVALDGEDVLPGFRLPLADLFA
jgi:Uma2 family endonuclease